LPANRIDEPTREEVEGLILANDWLGLAKLLKRAWNYAHSLERDGPWDWDVEGE
jgi:hypothetical protein